MSKPALGRGLGALLNGQPTPNGVRPPETNSEKPPEVGHGLEILLKRGNGQENGSGSETSEEIPKPVRSIFGLPRWYFLVADLLLLITAGALAYVAPKPLELNYLIFCGCLTVAGAIVAILAVVSRQSDDPTDLNGSSHWTRLDCIGLDGKPKHLIVHRTRPIFVGEVEHRGGAAEPQITPLWVEGEGGISDSITKHLIREGAHHLAQEHGQTNSTSSPLVPNQVRGAKISWLSEL